MGWPTKTNCSSPQPTLGNPASLLPYVYRPPALTQRERDAFCNLMPAPVPVPVPSANILVVDNPATPVTEPTLATIEPCLTLTAEITAEAVVVVTVDTAAESTVAPTLAAIIDSCLTPTPDVTAEITAEAVVVVTVDTAAAAPSTIATTALLNESASLTYAQLVADICAPHLSLSLPSLSAASNDTARASKTSHGRTAHQRRSTGTTPFTTVLPRHVALRPVPPHADAPLSSRHDLTGDSFSKSGVSRSGSHRAHPPPTSAYRGMSTHIPP